LAILRHEPRGDAALLERAKAFRPDLVAMGVLTNLWPFASKMAEKLKGAIGAPILIGGHHAQALPEYVLSNPNVDMVCTGEGEIAILELANRIIRLRGLRPGRDIDVVFTGPRPGEKLREELVADYESMVATAHPKVRRLMSGITVDGAEIFRLQTRALGLEAKYALIKDELERSDDFIAHTHGEVRDKQGHELNKLGYSLSRKATRAGSWALGLAVVALVIAVLQIGPHDDTATSQFWSALPTKIFDPSVWGQTSWRFVAAIVLAISAIAASLYGIYRFRSRDPKKTREQTTRRHRANDHG